MISGRSAAVRTLPSDDGRAVQACQWAIGSRRILPGRAGVTRRRQLAQAGKCRRQRRRCPAQVMRMDVRPVRKRHDRLAGIIVMMIAGDIDGERGSRFVRTVMTMHDPFRHRGKGHDRQQEQQHSTHHDGVVLWQAAESAKGWHDRPTMRRTSGKGNRGREATPAVHPALAAPIINRSRSSAAGSAGTARCPRNRTRNSRRVWAATICRNPDSRRRTGRCRSAWSR